jgi:hypothetical protein
MEEIRALTKDILKWVILLSVLASVVFILFFRSDALALILGLAFGASIGMLGFIDLSQTLQRAVKKSPEKAQSYTVRKYFIRFIINGVVIFIAVVAPYLNVIGTVLGMLLIKMSIMITNLFNDKQFYKNIIRGKEV